MNSKDKMICVMSLAGFGAIAACAIFFPQGVIIGFIAVGLLLYHIYDND